MRRQSVTGCNILFDKGGVDGYGWGEWRPCVDMEEAVKILYCMGFAMLVRSEILKCTCCGRLTTALEASARERMRGRYGWCGSKLLGLKKFREREAA